MKHNGIITPMITPFNKKGEIDYAATETLITYLKKIGVSGLFPLGSTGLFPFLREEERKKYLQFVANHASGMKIYAGIGSASTQISSDLAKHCNDLPVDVMVLMPPYYIQPGQKEILKHFDEVLKNVKKELFIYNIPQLSGTFIQPDTVLKLKENYSQITGLKESSGDMRYFSKLLEFSGPDFSIFQGQDDLLLASLALGADGGVCGLTNFSNPVIRCYKAYRNGDMAEARRIQFSEINSIMKVLNADRFPSGYYHAFYTRNRIDGGYRSPMMEPDDDSKKHSEEFLSKLKD
ncbi:dihydrodipicolinate synthase family protein [Oxyplasma meridianum]|uniref:Dihydrodipicolinate synthase family protein n=1 Tax=Oxyplasma meridianum TaxID=3073602 RepID=A0AAX4NGJ1_9ARCH